MTDLAAIKDELRTLLEKATPGPWVQSWFVDGPEYAHMSQPWKDARRSQEARLIRAIGPKGLHIANVENAWGEGEANAALLVAAVNALPALLADTPSVEPLDTQPLADLLNRIERHVDHECGADHRYAFMEEVRVMAGDLLPHPSVEPWETTGLRADLEYGFDKIAGWAVRYALGRMTYAVGDVTEVVSRNVAALSPDTRAQIVRDIDERAERDPNALGMDMDAARWQELRAALAAESKP